MMHEKSLLLLAVLVAPVIAIGCLDLCGSSSDCGTAGFFGTCESCVDYGSGGKCMTNGTCGDSCGSDQDCYGQYGFTETCAYCIEGVCSSLQECGGPCETADDCVGYSYSSSSCKNCVNNQCSNGCYAPCEDNFDCVSYPCLTCSAANSTCQEYQSCGGPCQSDIQCDPSSCSTCQDGVCSEPLACGTECSSNSECGFNACPDCVDGFCEYYGNCTYGMTNATSCYDIQDYCNFEYCLCSFSSNENGTYAFCFHNSNNNGTVTEEMALALPSLTVGSQYENFRLNENGLFEPVKPRVQVTRSMENGALVTESIVDNRYLREVGPRRGLPYHEQLLQLINPTTPAQKETGSVQKRQE